MTRPLVFTTALTIVTLLCSSNAVGERSAKLPSWVECTSNSDCGSGSCCTIGHQRYSYPTCRSLHRDGDICRPNGPLRTNGSRSYPHGVVIFLGDVYLMFCPCVEGLACSEGVCGANAAVSADANLNNFNSLLMD